MISPFLLLGVLVLGGSLQILSVSPADKLSKVFRYLVIDAIASLCIVALLFGWSKLTSHVEFNTNTLLTLTGVAFMFWVGLLSLHCRQFIIPKITEENLFLQHVITVLLVIPYIGDLLSTGHPIYVLILLVMTVLLAKSVIQKQAMAKWLKFVFAAWYIILILILSVARAIPLLLLLSSAPVVSSVSLENTLTWILDAGLLTHILLHLNLLLSLIPNRHTRWETYKKNMHFFVQRVSNKEANPQVIVLQTSVIIIAYTINFIFQLLTPLNFVTLMFLAVPLLTREVMFKVVKK